MTKPSEASAIPLGQIGAAHGIRGEVRVKSFTADQRSLSEYGPLRADDGRTFEIERLRPLKGDMLIVKFRGIGDRDAAEALNGTDLFIDRAALPPPAPDEYYHADLIGLDAVTGAVEPLGTIIAIHNFGAGDILEIASREGPPLLVPFTDANVPAIEVEAGRAIVNPPPDAESGEEQE